MIPLRPSELSTILPRPSSHLNWDEAFTAYARCARIVRDIKHATAPASGTAYQEKVEYELHSACESAAAKLEGCRAMLLSRWGRYLADLTAPINSFFDTVLVNAEEEDVRLARQALVQRIAQIPASVADLSRLQGF